MSYVDSFEIGHHDAWIAHQSVEEAVLAERERCAKVAENTLRIDGVFRKFEWIWIRCCVTVAAKIREGK